jgi:hypothetical protein
MAYGLEATTPNGQLTIDGGSSNYRGFQVITARTDTANSSFSNLSYNSGDLVFAQRTTTGPIGADLPSSTDNVGISHYFVARVANGFSGNQQSGTYGLQVKNQSGQVAFDSRNSIGGSFIGFSIERVYPPGTLAGQISSGSASITTGTVMISNIDPSDYYLLVLGSLYNVSTQSVQATLNWGGAYYDYTNNLIRYIGLVEIGTNPPPIISNVNIPFNNLNTVVLAKYIT